MPFLHFLQPLIPVLSAVLVAILGDALLRLLPQARDRLDPLLGIPARMAERLMSKLNRAERAQKTRASRGLITLLFMVIVAVALGGGAEALRRYYPEIEPVLWFLCFRATFPWTAGYELTREKKITPAKGLAILVRRRVPQFITVKNPDGHGVARMFIEATATSLHRGYLSPVLWGVVAALVHYPALFVAVFITALLEAERIIVTVDNIDTPFAQPFQLIEAIVNFVPARVAALLWVLGSCFTPGAKPGEALAGMFRQSEKHALVNNGWPEGAVAGALNVALPSGKKRDEWLGGKNATARADAADVQRVIFLHAVTLGLTVLIFTATLFIAIGS
jgi:adenosylcobinamide-phosphate synthase